MRCHQQFSLGAADEFRLEMCGQLARASWWAVAFPSDFVGFSLNDVAITSACFPCRERKRMWGSAFRFMNSDSFTLFRCQRCISSVGYFQEFSLTSVDTNLLNYNSTFLVVHFIEWFYTNFSFWAKNIYQLFLGLKPELVLLQISPVQYWGAGAVFLLQKNSF